MCLFVYVENVLCLIYDDEEQVFNKFVTKIKVAFQDSFPGFFRWELVH